jgi:glycosyltransferase involved in cell wall biosynthesis
VREKLRNKLNVEAHKNDYATWVTRYDTLTDVDRQAITAHIQKLPYQPLISVVMPVYNVDEQWLRLAIESVCQQLYPHWELCIADDKSDKPHVRRVLEEYSLRDERIGVIYRESRGHISAASNSALELAHGEFIALLDHDDELSEHALYMVALELNAWPEADLIFSDEDKLDQRGTRIAPHFKPDWNRDLFYSYNCISHLGVYRAAIVRQLGGLRQGYEGSQDYDLALRVIEQIPSAHIRHIPHVLYHWRELTGSLALGGGEKEYAHEAAREAIRSHLQRTGINATVTVGYGDFHRVVYPVPSPRPLVSLIITTMRDAGLVRRILKAIFDDTNYQPIELIVVVSPSSEPDCIEALRKDPRITLVQYNGANNLSAMNNLAAKQAKGDLIGLIDGGLKPVSSEWLTEMVGHALRPDIGAVGAKLYSGDETVQHGGIVLGIKGTIGYAHKGTSRQGPGYYARAQVIQNYSAVTGACLLMRRDLYLEIGGLNEVDLPNAFMDIDLCLRLQEMGYRILWTPYAELYHSEPPSGVVAVASDQLSQFTREQEFLRVKWKAYQQHDPCYSKNLTLDSEDFSYAMPPRVLRPWRVDQCVE